MPAPLAAIFGAFARSAAGSAQVAAGRSAFAGSSFGSAAEQAAMKKIQAGMRQQAAANQQLTQSFQQSAAVTIMSKLGFDQLTSAILGSNTPMVQLLNTMKHFAEPVAALVKLSNPGPVAQFELALRDAYAVLGRMLLPVLNSFTYGFRKVGDTFAKLEPVIAPFFEKVGNAMRIVFDAWSQAVMSNAGGYKLVVDVMGELVTGAAKAYAALMGFVSGIARFVDMARSFFGLPAAKVNRNASSVGAAVRDVRIGSSAEDLARRAQEQAFAALVNGPQKSPEEKTVSYLANIETLLANALPQFPTQKQVEAFITNLLNGLLPKGPSGKDVRDFSNGFGVGVAALLTR